MNDFLPDQGKNLLAGVSTKRPLFLSILCVLSFIMSGIMLIAFGVGIFSLFLSEATISGVWSSISQSQPQLTSTDAHAFFRAAGIYSCLAFLLQLTSLWGLIAIWKLRRVGFIIYTAAELAFYFIGLIVNFDGEANGIRGAFIYILFDLVFIGLYALNWKHLTPISRNKNS